MKVGGLNTLLFKDNKFVGERLNDTVGLVHICPGIKGIQEVQKQVFSGRIGPVRTCMKGGEIET